MKKYCFSIILVSFLSIPLITYQAFSEDKIDKASKLSKLEGFTEQADKLLQEAIMDDPTNPRVHFRAGEVYFNMNFERQGDQAFRNAFRSDSSYGPRIGERYFALGQIKLGRSQILDAKRYFTMAAEMNPSLKKNIAKHCLDAGEQLLIYQNDTKTANEFFSLATQYDPTLSKELNKVLLKKKMNDIQNEPIKIVVNPNALKPWPNWQYDVWEPLNKVKRSANASVEEFDSRKSFFNYDVIIWNIQQDSDFFHPVIDSLIKAGKFIVLCAENFPYITKKDERGEPVKGPDGRYIIISYVSDIANPILKKYGMEVINAGKQRIFETTMLKTHPITNNTNQMSIHMMWPIFINILDDKNVKIIAKSEDKTIMALYQDPSGGCLLVHGTRNFLIGQTRQNTQDPTILALTENIVKYQRDMNINKLRTEIANIK